MSQILNQQQEPEYKEECKIIIKSSKSFGLEYSKRFVNGKEFGHLNDFQSYESLDIKTVANFLRNKKIQNPVFVQGCKRLNTFENIRDQIKTYLEIIKGIY
jgi:hypothetical protein